jgi:hypothetical protein
MLTPQPPVSSYIPTAVQTNSLRIVYEEPQDSIPSNTSLLIRTFKDVVEAGVQNGEIDGITDESLEKLQKYLRTAISRATEDMRDALDTVRPSQQPEELVPAATVEGMTQFPIPLPPWHDVDFQWCPNFGTGASYGETGNDPGVEASDPLLTALEWNFE